MTGYLALEDGTVFHGESVAAEGFAFGEAVFTTAMTGYQEVVTDPSFAEQLVCFTAPMVGNYGVAAERSESRRPHARAVADARGARAGVDRLAPRARRRRALRDRHALARAAPARGRRDARRSRPAATALRRGGARGGSAAARDGRPRARRRASRRAEPYVFHEEGDVDVAVVDYGAKRSILRRLAQAGARVTVYPHDVDADTLAGARRRAALERPRRPGAARDGGRDRARPARPDAGARHLPRPPAARPRRGARDVQAPLRPPRREPPRRSSARAGASSSRARTTASRCGRREDREATHVSLYDGTVEGFRFPELRARSVQFHPEAGPGPHDAWPILEEFVAGAARCLGAPTSSRSA